MENASKALIIAGAILLAILIISLGIIIYNQAAGVAQDSNMDQLTINNFNAQWTNYEGNRVSGSQVNALLAAALANNTSEDSANRKITVTVNGASDGKNHNIAQNSTSITRVPTGDMYSVTCVYGTSGATQGVVTGITVTNLNSGGSNP